MKNKWFWTTFGGLGFFTLSVFCWALIFSPFNLQPKNLGKFETTINGQKQENQIWVCDGNFSDVLTETIQQWLNDNWRPISNGFDFAPKLLGLGSDSNLLSSFVQFRIFQKDSVYKTLALIEDPHKTQTYGWVSTTPYGITDISNALKQWNFPFLPPSKARRIFCQKNQNFEFAFIVLPCGENLLRIFTASCQSQNFSCQTIDDSGQQKIFLLRKGPTYLLAFLNSGVKENIISIVRLIKNSPS